MAFDRDKAKQVLSILAAKGVFVGTSSWKYEGWLGQLYTRARYTKQNRRKTADVSSDQGFFPQLQIEVAPVDEKFDDERFQRQCLTEYAEVFKTVSVDGAYYKFPTREYLEGLADQVPADFQFGFKVTDAITRKRFANQARSGKKAGQPNRDFLNADLFAAGFLKPCEYIRPKVGVLMFEFSRFLPSDYEHGQDFVADLDGFLGKLSKGWPYAIEMRNKNWLTPDYFDCLARHGITHVFNSWEAMPPVSEQMALPGSRSNPQLVAARFLLKPGRKYEAAVKEFEPYDRIKEVNLEARKAGRALIVEGEQFEPRRKTYIYVNNRLEGNALESIDAMLARENAIEAAGWTGPRGGQ